MPHIAITKKFIVSITTQDMLVTDHEQKAGIFGNHTKIEWA